MEACDCDVACQCIWMEPPDDDARTVSFGWHITDGHYGDVDLSGLSVAMLVASNEGVMFGPGIQWDVVRFVDEAADDDQREAIQAIYTGQAGGIWAAIAEAHVRSAEIEVAPIEFTRAGNDFSVEVPDVLSMDAGGATGFNDELGTILPHPLTTSLKMGTGKSREAIVSYNDQFDWDVSGHNSYLGDFELASG